MPVFHVLMLTLALLFAGPTPPECRALEPDPEAEKATLETCLTNCHMIELDFRTYVSLVAEMKATGRMKAGAKPDVPTLDLLSKPAPCPAGGTYRLEVRGAGTDAEPIVRCSVHGTPSEMDEALAALRRRRAELEIKREEAEFAQKLARDRLHPPTEAQIKGETAAKSCEANLRLIDGATGLFLLGNPSPPPGGLTPALLAERKLLLTVPRCEEGGEYRIEVKDRRGVASCSIHGKAGAIRIPAKEAAPTEGGK